MLEAGYVLRQGDVLKQLGKMPDNSVHVVVTSPPYLGLRDYGIEPTKWPAVDYETLGGSVSVKAMKCCLGLEPTTAAFIAHLVLVFREVRRVLRPDGTCWVNMGDSYANAGTGGNGATGGLDKSTLRSSMPPPGTTPVKKTIPAGLKAKDLCGMPWRLAFALQGDGWWLRQDIVWAKPNPMPESVTDRCTKAHEYIFLLSKSRHYYYDAEAIKEPANGWNGSEFHDGKNAEVHPNVGKNRAHSRGKAVNPKSLEASPGMKQNPSFSGAVSQIVEKRNKRSVWEIATESFDEAHFATFPTKLVRPCIMAGISERGACAGCGTPWKRMLEKSAEYAERSGKRMNGYDYEGDAKNGMSVDNKMNAEWITVGWKKQCKCETNELVASHVLDPFNGSGTTGIVALANRCFYTGIDLNPKYIVMAERRLSNVFAQRTLL